MLPVLIGGESIRTRNNMATIAPTHTAGRVGRPVGGGYRALGHSGQGRGAAARSSARRRTRPHLVVCEHSALGGCSQYLQLVDGFIAHGFRAIKLHAWGLPDKDMELCRVVRADLPGHYIALMFDAEGNYDYASALDAAVYLASLDFCWFEAPLPDADFASYRELHAPDAPSDPSRGQLGARVVARGRSHRDPKRGAQRPLTWARAVASLPLAKFWHSPRQQG